MDHDISPELAALYDRFLAERAGLDPNWATRVGIHDHDPLLTRYDDASHDARVRFVVTWLAKVPGDSLDARLWRSELLSMQFEYRRRDARTDSPALPFGAISVIHDMSVKDFAPVEERITHFFRHSREKKDKILKAEDVAQTIVEAIKLPQRAMISEIDIRPTNP